MREQADSRAAYFRQETNVKEYGQGRFLFQQCREEYFVILHDDDAMARDLLEFAVDVLAKDPALAFVSTGQRLIDENGRAQEELTRWYSAQQGRDRFPEGRLDDLLDPLLRFGLFSISGSVFRTAALRDSALVDPDLGGSYPFEFNVFLRVAERGWPAFYTPRPLLAYRWHHDSMRAAEKPSFHKEMTANLITLVERRRFSGPAERRRRRLLSFNHRNYAIVSYLDGARLQSYRHLARAVRLNPWSPKIWAYVFLRAFLPFPDRAALRLARRAGSQPMTGWRDARTPGPGSGARVRVQGTGEGVAKTGERLPAALLQAEVLAQEGEGCVERGPEEEARPQHQGEQDRGLPGVLRRVEAPQAVQPPHADRTVGEGGARPLEMDDAQMREMVDRVAAGSHPAAPLHVLRVHEEALVEEADFLQGAPPYEQGGPAYPVDGERLVGTRGQEEPGEGPRPEPGKEDTVVEEHPQ